MKRGFHGAQKVGLQIMVESEGIIGKAEWRRRLAGLRDGLSADERANRSEKLCERVRLEVLDPLRIRSNRPLNVCAYAPFRSEASPLPLIKSGWEQGDRIFAPRIIPGGEGMELREVEALSDWIPGKWGVPEPDPQKTLLIEGRQPLDVVLVPGIAFHIQGGRLGYGGGYYDRLYADRLLSGNGETIWLGFCFAAQVVTELLPVEPHDLRLSGVATEERVVWFR